MMNIFKVWSRQLVSLFIITLLFFTPAFGLITSVGTSKVAGQSAKKFYDNALQLKFADSSGITVQNNSFVGENPELNELNALLDNAQKAKIEKLKAGKAGNALQHKLDMAIGGYYRIKLHNSTDIQKLATELNKLSVVVEAYAEPTPAPAPTADYTGLQNYLTAAPNGIDSDYAKTVDGGTGERVKIYNLDYSWNTSHEDLSKSRTALVPNGTPRDPFNNTDHGTAAVGIMIADANGFGVTGAAKDASLRLVNVENVERGYDPVNALYLAAATAHPGDVVVIEQQSWGPTPEMYDFVPLEWIPAVYDAVKALTGAGVHVVEAAGNGNQNLDDSTYYGSSFPAGKPSSGAIIVGAGYNCAGTQRLSRMGYSTYGSRVDLQGPGECVTTTGYGGLSAENSNATYTSSYNGTSSATPVVAAAIASLSSLYEMRYQTAPSTSYIRNLLVSTGTSQNLTAGTISGNIGALPNLNRAVLTGGLNDTVAPATPAGFRVVLNKSGKPALSWNASTDNVRVTGYRVYRNGVLLATTASLAYVDSLASKRTTYTYQIAAVDFAGNVSALTSAISIRTK